MENQSIEIRRYIKDFESENIFKNYVNANFVFLLNAVAGCLGHRNGTQVEYSKTKKAICEYINKNFGNYNVSKRQLSKLIKPQKNMVSKYAPLYLIAMYNILLQNWPESLHTDICCRREYDNTYSEFALSKFIKMKERCSWNNLDDDLIRTFDKYLGIVNQNIPDTLGKEFSNEHPKRKIEL